MALNPLLAMVQGKRGAFDEPCTDAISVGFLLHMDEGTFFFSC